jgi:hypothetical protein
MMPNRRAVNRAYLHAALEHGLTAAVLDPTVDYGERAPGKQILSIVRDLAANDGSDTVFGVNAISQEHGSGGRGCMVFQNGRWHRQR